MSFLSSVGGFLKGAFSFLISEEKKVVSWIESPEGQAIGKELSTISQALAPFSIELSKAGFIPAKVLDVFNKYAVPAIGELADGTLVTDVKATIKASLLAYVEKTFRVSETEATIAANVVYLAVQNVIK